MKRRKSKLRWSKNHHFDEISNFFKFVLNRSQIDFLGSATSEKSILDIMDFIIEILRFLKVRKKYWLLPIFIVLAIFGALIVLSQGSVVAPFIYTIF